MPYIQPIIESSVLKLVLPNMDLVSSYLDCQQKIVIKGGRPNQAEIEAEIELLKTDPQKVLQKFEDERNGINLSEGKVAKTKLWIVSSNEVVGSLVLTKILPKNHTYPSNLGYIIKPSQRGKGYATEACRLGLQVLKSDFGLEKAYISCNQDNPASRRVIEKNGGTLFDEVLGPDGIAKLRFLVEL